MENQNAAAQIIAACNEVFEEGWKNQVEYLRSRYVEYAAAEVAAAESAAAAGIYSINAINVETFFYRAVYRVEKGKPFLDLKATARANFNQLVSAMRQIQKNGFEAYVAKQRESYLQDLTAYLRLSLEKKNVQDFPEAGNISVMGSAKGYKVVAKVDGRLLVTNCVPVGGYNIVRFHYRYTVKF